MIISIRTTFLVVVTAVGGCCFASKAAAQDATGAFYNDIKDVIGNVISREVSQTIAPRAACLAGRKPVTGAPGPFDVDIASETADPPHQYVSLAMGTYFPRTLQHVYDGQFVNLRSTLLDEAPNLVADMVYKILTTSPSSPFPDYQFSLLADPQIEDCSDNLKALLEQRKFESAPTPIDDECAASSKDRVEYACDLAFAARDALRGNAGDAEADLQRALAALIAEWKLHHKPETQEVDVTVGIVRTMLASKDTAKAVKDAMKALDDAFKPSPAPSAAGAQSATKPPPAGGPGAEVQPDTLEIALTAVTDQWKAFHANAGRATTVTVFLDGMGALGSVVASACKMPDGSALPPACKAFSGEEEALKTYPNVLAIFRLMTEKDYTDALQLAVDAIFNKIGSDECEPKKIDVGIAKLPLINKPNPESISCTEVGLFRRFAHAVVGYAMEALPNQTPTDAARETFRSAATDLIIELSKGGGIDRSFGGSLVWPRLSVEAAWSPSYVNSSPGTARSLASLTWLTARIPIYRSRLAYSALEVSAVDLLAPFTELVLRNRDAAYLDQSLLAWNLVTPRVDAVAGMPVLSTHLVLGGGVAYRMVAPFLEKVGTATSPVSYTYDSCLSPSRAGNWSNCLQVGAFVRYEL